MTTPSTSPLALAPPSSPATSASPTPPQGGARAPKLGRGDTVIKADRVSLWYGSVIGVNNISVELGQGVFGLLGPNGAGKSSFLKCMTGQLEPKTGQVTILGQPVWNNASIFASVGFVPEQDAFYEDMTGHQFVATLTRLQGYSPQDAARLADEAIEQVDLSEKRHQPIREYSKGMRQRIKIAQALAHRPQVLFLDEPLTGTDPVGRKRIVELIAGLGRQGKTIVVSSHVLHEVEQMTTEILLINKGRLVADGQVHGIRALIDTHPHTIHVGVDDPRRLAALMAPHEDVVELRFLAQEPQALLIATRDPDACYDRLPRLARKHGLRITRISSPDNNLMAVFHYLVS